MAEAVPLAAKDHLRPGYHFLPAARFMNDPNGCVKFDGRVHMFFQHLPFWGQSGAPLAPGWGHAVSRDFVNWERWPIALMPVPETYDGAAIASGYCVVADGQPTIIYTSAPPQAQSLARSFDGMKTWRKFTGNPVIAKPPDVPGLDDGFRDPFVWREADGWRMLVGSGIRGQGGTVLLYESADLFTWNFISTLCVGMGPDCFQWECPNFFPLGDKWVLVISPLFRSIPALRGPVQYAVGTYDGRHFEHGDWHLLDAGGAGVYYAPNSLEDERGRRIQWGWLMGGGSPGTLWDGMLTMPRQLELGPDQRLRTWPAIEVDTLRAELLAERGEWDIQPQDAVAVAEGAQLDVLIDLAPWGPGRLNVEVFRGPADGQSTTVSFDLTTGELRCQEKVVVLPRNAGDLCTLRILVDRSVVEIYGDHREVMSVRALPAAEATGLRLAAERAPVRVKKLRVWRMASIW